MTDNKTVKIESEGEDFLDFSAQNSEDGIIEEREIEISLNAHGKRLDVALSECLPEFSRSFVQQLMQEALVTLLPPKSSFPSSAWASPAASPSSPVEPKSLKASAKVKAGDRFKVRIRETEQTQAFVAQEMPLEVVFEDAHLRVINKPAGLVVHPAAGHWSGTLLNGLLALDEGAKFVPRAGIVHRLDKDTSGLMVIAKTRECMDRLIAMITQREVKREYVCITHGASLVGQRMELHHAIGRDTRNRLRMAVVDLAHQAGKVAHTSCVCLANQDQFSLMYCQLHTGRTHQIRVHLSAQQHPIFGDTLYGAKGTGEGGLKRQALHAFRLSFAHPYGGEKMVFFADLPQDLLGVAQSLGLSYNLSIIDMPTSL
jgi:23S rRNA pseudouridine1911/1915/1917 synthase